jgi:hypothetical protein
MNLLLPACNSSSDSARGCLLGILPDFFGCNRRAITNLLRVLFEHITPNLPSTAFGTQISNWYSFQEFFGLRPALLSNTAQKKLNFSFVAFAMKPGQSFSPQLKQPVLSTFTVA